MLSETSINFSAELKGEMCEQCENKWGAKASRVNHEKDDVCGPILQSTFFHKKLLPKYKVLVNVILNWLMSMFSPIQLFMKGHGILPDSERILWTHCTHPAKLKLWGCDTKIAAATKTGKHEHTNKQVEE